MPQSAAWTNLGYFRLHRKPRLYEAVSHRKDHKNTKVPACPGSTMPREVTQSQDHLSVLFVLIFIKEVGQ